MKMSEDLANKIKLKSMIKDLTKLESMIKNFAKKLLKFDPVLAIDAANKLTLYLISCVTDNNPEIALKAYEVLYESGTTFIKEHFEDLKDMEDSSNEGK